MIDSAHSATLAEWLEDAWLQRYLDRELNDAESAWFEAYMLDKPRLIAAIDTDNALRDGIHAWHAQQLGDAAQTSSDAITTPPAPASVEIASSELKRNSKPLPFAGAYRFLPMAAAICVGALLGAAAARWLIPATAVLPVINSPNRIVFDTMRGSAAEPVVERPQDVGAALLIDVAVPLQATDVVAYFSDQSSLSLPISADGFVLLSGPRADLLAASPVRIAWNVDGVAQQRQIDIRAALRNLPL